MSHNAVSSEEPESIDSYLTVGEAADLLGVSASTLRRWGRAGKLKAVRNPMNSYRLYRRDELTALLEQIKSGSDVPAGGRV